MENFGRADSFINYITSMPDRINNRLRRNFLEYKIASLAWDNVARFMHKNCLRCVKGDFPDRENVSVADKRVPAFGERCHEVTEGLL